MKKTKILLLILYTTFLFSCNHTKKNTPYVVVVSLDGFKWDYPDYANTPFLDSVEKIGSRIHTVEPSFPSKTFPSHYSIATGLHPGNHGIINNNFYDSSSNRYYSINNKKAVNDGYFYGGEPIWVTAKKNNINTATFFWVGAEAEIQGMHPDIYKTYQHDFPYQARIDSVVQWLKKPIKERPKLIMLYFDQPDKLGHFYGDKDSLTLNMVTKMDGYMKNLYQQLQQLPIKDSINLIITSDHGMTTIDSTHHIVLSDYLNNKWIDKITGKNPVYNIKAKAGYSDSITEALSGIPHLLYWKKEDLPSSFQYKHNPRILDIVVCADLGWGLHEQPSPKYHRGGHGYPPEYKDMHAIFYATGPDFKQNYSLSSCKNIDIYNMICYILDINPAPNDGDFIRVHHILK